MASTDIGTVFLDRELRVHRFTPCVKVLSDLFPTDVGRPLSDITDKLAYPDLTRDAEQVLDDLSTIEREVTGIAGQWWLARLAPYRTAEGRVVGVVATFIDITRRKAAEEELQYELSKRFESQLHRFNTVMTAVPDFIYHFDLEGRFSYVNQSLLDLWQKTHEEAVGKNFYDLEYPPELAAILQRQIQEVIETRRPLKDETPYTSAIGSRQYEYIFFPLLAEDGSVEAVGGVTRDVTDRKEAVQALRDSEARFRAMFEQARIGIAQVDGKGRFLAANPGFCQFIGYTEEELRQKEVRDVTHPDDYLDGVELMRQLAAGEIPDFTTEKRYLQKGGATVWGSVTATQVRGESGEPLYTLAIIQAIDDRKRTEGQLRESEERFRAMFEQAQVGIVQISPEKKFLAFNPVFLRMLGYRADDLLEKGPVGITHPDDVERETALALRLLAGEIPNYTIEKRYIRKDNGVIWAQMTGAVVRDGAGEPLYILGTVEEISARRLAEEKLRLSEERFRQFAENSADVFWIVDAKTQQLEYVNPIYEKLWGEPRGPLMSDADRWLQMVHPDDREMASARMPRVMEGETVVIEYRIVRPHGGGVRWMRDTAFPIRNEGGEIYRVAGVAQDVTEDKNRAEALGRSEERFRLLVEGARDYAMFLLDPGNVITFWSKGAERVFGWTQAEAVGQRGEIIFTPEDRANAEVEKEIETALADRRAADRRFHLRKDGSRFWADGVLMRLDDAPEAPRGFAKVTRDATDQRRIEDELRHARDEQERRVVERTRDLTATNTELQQNIAERRQLERELLEISEREKRRIGEDLHDIVCQELTATALFLKSSAKKVAKQSSAAAETLEESAQTVNRNVGIARELARTLQAVELSAAGLKNALRALAVQAGENSEILCHFKAARGVRVPDDTVALHLYRIAQEAMANAVKHSGAKNILISLDRNSAHISVSVQDDGKGFIVRKRRKGLGLHMMRYRANALGGELKIERRRSGGMDVICVIPSKH